MSRGLIGFVGSGGGGGTDNGMPGIPQFPGFYYTQFSATGDGSNVAALNRLYMTPFYVPEETTYDLVGIVVTVAGSAGAVLRIGAYAVGANGAPDALLDEYGTVDTTSTGAKTVAISKTYQKGWIYLGGVAQVATCTVRARPSSYLIPETSVGSNANQSFNLSGVSGALPSSFGAPGMINESVKVQLRPV